MYPGADAATLEANVTQIIEQELNGVEGFLYMASSSQSNGAATITLTFASGTDIDDAQMDVQNRLSAVEQRLPEEVRRQGIVINQASSSFLLIIALTSKSGDTSSLELGNFAVTRVVDELRRVAGVGDIRSFSSEYAMRIWLDPDKLATYQLSAADALAAVREQNTQSPGGQLGDVPLAEGSRVERGDPHAESLHDARAVRLDHPASESRRLGRAARRRRARRARRADRIFSTRR